MDIESKKEFPNGFNSWIETHHEIVAFITTILLQHYESHDTKHKNTSVIQVKEENGTMGLYAIGVEWTDAFEECYSPKFWEENPTVEYFEEIQKFCAIKNQIN